MYYLFELMHRLKLPSLPYSELLTLKIQSGTRDYDCSYPSGPSQIDNRRQRVYVESIACPLIAKFQDNRLMLAMAVPIAAPPTLDFLCCT